MIDAKNSGVLEDLNTGNDQAQDKQQNKANHQAGKEKQ